MSITKDFWEDYSATPEEMQPEMVDALLAHTRALEAMLKEEHRSNVLEHESWEDHVNHTSAWNNEPCEICKALEGVE